MPTQSFAGLRIEWTCDAFWASRDPLKALFAWTSPSMPEGDEAGIFIQIRKAGRAPPDPAQDPDWQLYFFQGAILVYRPRESATKTKTNTKKLLFWDGKSQVRAGLNNTKISKIEADLDSGQDFAQTKNILQLALVTALLRHRVYPLHAAAFLHPEGCRILAAGASGAGKSTLALALLDAGYFCLSDDTVFVRLRGHTLELHALARAFHLGPQTQAAFPHLKSFFGAALDSKGPQQKCLFEPEQAYPGHLLSALEWSGHPALLLAPRIDPAQPTHAAPISKADALGHLLASSAAFMLEDLCEREHNLEALRRIADQALCFELCLGGDMLCAPAQSLSGTLFSLIEAALQKRLET